MAIKFRLADTARENMESLRSVMRRRAACLMAAIVLGFAVLLGVVKVFIAPPPAPEFEIYTPTKEDKDELVVEKKQDLSTKSAPVSQPVPTVIVATDVTMATDWTLDVTEVDLNDSVTDWGDGMGGDGLGNGIGNGRSSGGMGGEKTESSFLGVFYDLKKKKDGSPSPYAPKDAIYNADVLRVESLFVNKAWDMQTLSPYFRSRRQLYSTCFFMPNCIDREACHAYDPDGKMGLKPGRWMAVYRAKVKAPASGKFRFLGAADSVMAVRFDGKNVLFCGLHDLKACSWNEWAIESNPDATKGRDVYAYESCQFWNAMMGGFVAGEEFTVKEGQWYEMQVLVSEIGGGDFGFCLLIDDVDNTAKKKRTKTGVPIFQLFRTDFSAPTGKTAYENIEHKRLNADGSLNEASATDPPYDEDSAIWVARPVEPDVRMK